MLVGLLIGFVITVILAVPLIWVVGKLGLGINVDGFRPALVTGLYIGLMGAVATLMWNLIDYTPAGGLPGAITHMILNAGLIYSVRDSVSGLEVKGWGGAIIAAVAVAGFAWLINLGLTAVL